MNQYTRNIVSHRCASRGAQRGLTLVELMVAMLLGLLLTAGAIQVFMSNRVTYAFNESLSRVQENARFALQEIADTARMGGYLGCIANVGVFNNLEAQNDFRDDVEIGVQGFDYNGTGAGDKLEASAVNPAPSGNANAWTPSLPVELSTPARVIPGSDVLVVRHVAADSTPLVAPFNDDSKVTAASGAPFQPGEILVVTDCQKASIFQVSGIAMAGTDVELTHAQGAGLNPGNAASGLWSTEQSYGLGAEVGRLEVTAYYVGRGQSGSPALFRLRLRRTSATTSAFESEELVEGIETMQVRYGLDTNGDRQVDTWSSAAAIEAANSWPDVLTAEVSLLVRADEEYGTESDDSVYAVGGMEFKPQEDRRFRRVFSTMIGLRNRLP